MGNRERDVGSDTDVVCRDDAIPGIRIDFTRG